MFGPAGVLPVASRPGVVDLAQVKAKGGLRKKNAGASLWTWATAARSWSSTPR